MSLSSQPWPYLPPSPTLLYQEVWARSIKSERSKEERRVAKTKEKEGQCWINTLVTYREQIPENIEAILRVGLDSTSCSVFRNQSGTRAEHGDLKTEPDKRRVPLL